MRITLSDPAQLQSLVRFLEFDQNVLTTTLGENELEVGFIGSLNSSAQEKETELRLRSWMKSHPGVVAVLND